MRTFPALVIGLVFALTLPACTDTPPPTSKGTRAFGGEVQEVAEGRAVTEVEKGVVPDLVGVTVADSREALERAGFKAGTLDTEGLFGDVEPNYVVCSHLPAAGESPPKGTKVDLTADRDC